MQEHVGRRPRALPSVTLRLHSIPGQPPLARCSAHVIKANSLADVAAIAPRRHERGREMDQASAPASGAGPGWTAYCPRHGRAPVAPSPGGCLLPRAVIAAVSTYLRCFPMQDSPGTAWPPRAPRQTNPTDSFLRAPLWPLPRRRMGLGCAQGEGGAALRDLGVASPALVGAGLDWESRGWPAGHGVPRRGRQHAAQSNWERHIPGRAGRVENDRKFFVGSPAFPPSRFMTHGLKIPVASSLTARGAPGCVGPGACPRHTGLPQAAGAAGTLATPRSPLPAQGLTLNSPWGHPSPPFGDDRTGPGTL